MKGYIERMKKRCSLYDRRIYSCLGRYIDGWMVNREWCAFPRINEIKKKKKKRTQYVSCLCSRSRDTRYFRYKEGRIRKGVWWWRSDGHMTLSGHMTYHPIGDWQDYREAKTWHPACPQALTNRVEQTSDRNRTDCSACQLCW